MRRFLSTIVPNSFLFMDLQFPARPKFSITPDIFGSVEERGSLLDSCC